MRSDTAVEPKTHKHVFTLDPPSVVAKSRWKKTTIWGAAATAEKKAAPLLVERIVQAHTILCSADDMADSIVESVWNDFKHGQKVLWTNFRSPLHMGIEIESVFSEFVIMKTADAEAIGRSRLIKWASLLQCPALKVVESCLEPTFQARCSNEERGHKNALFKEIKGVIG